MGSKQMVGGNAHHCISLPNKLGKTSANLTILPASWQDLNSLFQLEKNCFGEDAHGYLDVLGMLTFPGYVRLKALIEGQLTGFVIAEHRRGKRPAWIDAIGVAGEYRRRGIATALMSVCEKNLGASSIRLYVRRSNLSAIELYKQVGYHQAEIRHRYYVNREDALVMEKIVDIQSK